MSQSRTCIIVVHFKIFLKNSFNQRSTSRLFFVEHTTSYVSKKMTNWRLQSKLYIDIFNTMSCILVLSKHVTSYNLDELHALKIFRQFVFLLCQRHIGFHQELRISHQPCANSDEKASHCCTIPQVGELSFPQLQVIHILGIHYFERV